MSANKKPNSFLKKSTGSKPPTRNVIKAQQRKGGLGRIGHGLNSLIPSSEPPVEKETVAQPAVSVPAAQVAAVSPQVESVVAGNIIEIPPLDILRCPWQPRSEFNEELLRELADSIKANGIIQPPVCRRLPNGKYELIVGERRLRASVMAGMAKIKVVLVDASDQKVAEMAVTENIQRRDLNVIEEAIQNSKLIRVMPLDKEQNETVYIKIAHKTTKIMDAITLIVGMDIVDNCQSERELIRKLRYRKKNLDIEDIENEFEYDNLDYELVDQSKPKEVEKESSISFVFGLRHT